MNAIQGAVELNWDAVTGAVRYTLWVWTSSGGHQQIDEGTLTGTSYTHPALAVGTTYFYTARAVNPAGEFSEWSEWVSVTVTEAGTLTPAQIYSVVSPAIAFIQTSIGSGSGVLIEGGYVVTNAHVVWPFDTARVVFPDGTEFNQVAVKNWDLLADLAVLGPIDAPAQPATLLDGENIPIGSDMYLIGYPGEFEELPQPTIVSGILSRLREWGPGGITYFQTGAPTTGGQSGGALVSETGAVIGISGFKIFGEFALSASSADLLPRIQQLIAGGDPSGLGARRLPLEGGARRHELTLQNYWDDPVYVINEPAVTGIAFGLFGQYDGVVSVSDPYGNGLLFDYYSILGFVSRSFFTGVGPHFLSISQWSETPGEYILAASHNLIPFNDPDRGRQIQVGQSIRGNIDFPGDVDHFFLDLEENDTVEILAQSALADMFLKIDFLGWTHFLYDDNSGGGLFGKDSRITFTASRSGRYFVVVNDPDNNAPGGYIISVNALPRN